MADAEDVILRTLRREAGTSLDNQARKVLADLAGHGLLATTGPRRRPGSPAGPAPRCGRPAPLGHPNTTLQGGHCPICQWTPE